jgi:hypothetical protein
MSWLLVVQPDSVQADALREALRTLALENVVIAESLDDALSSIDLRVPDVILLPALIPASVEDYVIAYLGTIPSAGHVQFLGLPRLGRSDDAVQHQTRSRFPWRRRQERRAIGTPGCDPDVFARDVIAYLASARVLKEELELGRAYAAMNGGPERRTEPRFANDEVPWISFVRLGGQRAALINLSSRGALLQTHARPEHHLLKRFDPNIRERSGLTLELASEREVHAMGRVIRCVPLKTSTRTQYEIAFAFDDAVRLHLPASDALVTASSGPGPEDRVRRMA